MTVYGSEPVDKSTAISESIDVTPDRQESPFPVLYESSLNYIPRKFGRIAKRPLDEVPKARPGTCLVFTVGSRYVVFDGHRHLTGKEECVVDATAACLVDMRTRNYEILVPIPSTSAADEFTIKISFLARVKNPERAAEEGSINLKGFLKNYLAQDPKLFKLGSRSPVEKIHDVRDQVITRIEAYCELHPIELPGVAVVLASSSVLTPDELKQHETRLRDERRQQELNRLRAEEEDNDIRRHAGYVADGSDVLTAVGLSRGHTSINEAISNKRDDEKRKQERLAEAIRILQQNGGLDYLDIDPNEIAKAYLESLTGQSSPGVTRQEVPRGESHEALAPGLDDDLEDDDLDDDDEVDDATDT